MKSLNHLSDSMLFAIDQHVDNFAPARLGNRIEYVGGRGGTGH
jgi:hypothetical protein